MKKYIITLNPLKTLFLVAFLFLTNSSFSQTKNFLDQPYLETEVAADSLVTPDEIFIRITLKESDTKNRKSTEELERDMIKVLKALKIDIKQDLTLEDFSSNYKKYFLTSKKVLKYKKYSLKVSSANIASNVLVGLESKGISNVSVYKVSFSKEDALLLDLKTQAIKKAKKSAEYIIKPTGQQIGKLLHVSDYNIPYQNKARGEVMYLGMKEVAVQKDDTSLIEFKKLKFSVHLKVKFAIN